ncbi:PP2C family serine/threonine-protein phosphatase [Herbiconiux sp. VKM Ac-2851]|uniref:PP2C family protein-serine/threonine phosphatase n=1 Tax=Herbiconiux sp. VKM Ac-2851 TaxID=2739025 RepID=UPI001564AD8C|nr:protein serine/threonine phosphatase 2C family protein [Herbiconiux sp. VKM Ac-2851]
MRFSTDPGLTSRSLSFYATVCDGVGGGPDGARCSALAGRLAFDSLATSAHHRKRLVDHLSGLPAEISRALSAAADEPINPLDRAAATTFAGAVVVDGIAWVATVGDCQAVVVRGGEVLEASTPHNLWAQSLLTRHNDLPASNSATYLASTLTRRLRADNRFAVPTASLLVVPLAVGDWLMVSTDGVHESLGLARMAQIVDDATADASVQAVANALVDSAVSVAGPEADNATVVVAALGRDRT